MSIYEAQWLRVLEREVRKSDRKIAKCIGSKN